MKSTITIYETEDGVTVSWRDDPDAPEEVIKARAAICELAYIVLDAENLTDIN